METKIPGPNYDSLSKTKRKTFYKMEDLDYLEYLDTEIRKIHPEYKGKDQVFTSNFSTDQANKGMLTVFYYMNVVYMGSVLIL